MLKARFEAGFFVPEICRKLKFLLLSFNRQGRVRLSMKDAAPAAPEAPAAE